MDRTKPPKVNVTKNYRLFQLTDKNRPLDMKSHRRLRESMQKFGFLASFPISVMRETSGVLIVKDGQHRLAIAETLGLSVYWIEESVDFDIATVNNGQKCWKMIDYAQSFAKQGVKAYQELLDFSERRSIGLQLSALLLSGTMSVGNIRDKFNSGRFEIKDWQLAGTVADILLPFIKADRSYRNSRLAEALVACVRSEGFDPKRLIENIGRCHDKLRHFSTRDGFLEMLEDIYNFRKQKLVPLKINAITAMRARNPAAAD